MQHLTDWHRRFKQQATWTANLRQYLLNIANLEPGSKILDVGCGTGALFSDFDPVNSTLVGLDIDKSSLLFAKELAQKPGLICGDGYRLPIRSGSFDLVFCHYLLLWCKDPLAILKEMHRVTKKGGMVMCFAEPDYTSRIDHPEEFRRLGRLQ
ncbi:MAG: class I SAM-dependent methyltransferase, partial [Anaerolineaceae bacterium]|nr:class I SAM-dependent methyltransferase [Anaerolineaceae bacterium]